MVPLWRLWCLWGFLVGCFVPCVPLALCFVLLGSVSFSPCPSWAVGLPHWVWDVLRVWAIFVTVFGPLVGTVLSGPFLSLCGACWDMSFPSVLCLFFESFPIGLVLFLFSFFPFLIPFFPFGTGVCVAGSWDFFLGCLVFLGVFLGRPAARVFSCPYRFGWKQPYKRNAYRKNDVWSPWAEIHYFAM